MQNLVLLLPRLLAGVCGALLGVWCVSGAYQAGEDLAGFPAAIGFSAMVVGCWFIPAIVRTTTLGTSIVGYLVFAVGTAVVLLTAIGNGAKHRSANVGTARETIAAYTQAETDVARLTAELSVMQTNPKRPGEAHPRWTATAGCANATVPESEDYCKNVRRVRSEMETARAVLAKGRPLTADPQAASLRKLINMTPDQLNDWIPIWLAIASEVVASGLMTLAFAPVRAPHKPVEAANPTEPPQDSWMASTPLETNPWPAYTGKNPFGRVDGRKLRWLPTNPRLNDNKAA